MKIAALAITYKRPKELAEAVESFLRQTYAHKQLIILDDAGQYDPHACDGLPGVKFVTTAERFPTMGDKRNASAVLAPDADAYCVWDDDDIYLPWHLSACAATLASGCDYTIPSRLLIHRRGGTFQKVNDRGIFHGGWSFTRAAFERVGGYPPEQSGQDQSLLRRFKAARLRRGDTIQADARPSYIYRWGSTPSGWHISSEANRKQGGYERLAEKPCERVERLVPGWSRDWTS